MKKLLLSATALSVLAAMTPGSASAADMPVRQRTPVVAAPAVVPEWTGFYVGGNAGGSIGVDAVSQNAVFTSDALGTNGLLSSSNRYVTTGWVYGGQVGYNWQISRWVLGVEADWQGISQKDSASNCAPAATTVAFFNAGGSGFGYCLASEQKLTNLTTVRGRGGILVHDSLWYVTGGAAWGKVKDTYTFVGSLSQLADSFFQPGPFFPGAAGFSTTRSGWTLGGGVETKIAAGWSVKLEYLYVDLGSIVEVLPITINPVFGPEFTAGGVAAATSTWHIRDNIIRLGLNYQFGSYYAPALTK